MVYSNPMPRLCLALLTCALALAVLPVRSWSRHDPGQTWRELSTEHFLFIYPQAQAQAAARAAAWAERIYPQARDLFGYAPPGRTPVVLSASRDVANGYAQAVYRKLELDLTAPENKFFGPRDTEWLAMVLRHEYAHLCHGMRSDGLTAAVAAVFGEVNAVNLVAPRWWVEGMAVYAETELAESGGRGRSPWQDLELAANLLSDEPWTLGQLDHDPAWAYPADRVYVPGYDILQQLEADTRQKGLISHLSGQQSAWPLFGLGHVWALAAGLTPGEVWQEVQINRTAEFRGQLGEDRLAMPHARVAIEDPRATFSQPKWTRHQGLVAYRQSQDQDAALVRIDPARQQAFVVARPDLPHARYDYEPGQDLYVYARLLLDPVYTSTLTADLFESTASGAERRLTRASRAWSPALSPDGRLACVVNAFGATRLGLVDRERGSVDLITGPRGANYASPAWSPDGRRLAASVRLAGRQDICVVDVATGELSALTGWDEAGDFDPAWSPDGRRVFFVSDRGGTYQIYAWDFDRQALWQVTQAWLGAFDPAVSPDGRWLIFAEYRPGNTQRIVMAPLDPVNWQARSLDPPHPQPEAEPEFSLPLADGPGYSAWPHLAPTYWMPLWGEDQDGLLWGAASGRQDPLALHSWWAQVLWQPASQEVYAEASYTNQETPLIVTPRLFREPRSRYGRPGEQGSDVLYWYRAAGAGLQAQLPLVLQIATDRVTSLTLGAGGEAMRLESDTPALFAASSVWSWNGGATFFSGVQHSRDPFPLLGVLGSAWYQAPGPNQWFDGWALAGTGEAYLPGFFPGHAWKVGGRGLTQSGILPYTYSEPCPLGWSGGVFSASRVLTLSAAYRLPLAHLDQGPGLFPFFFHTLWLEALAEQGAGWEGGLTWPQWQERSKTSLGAVVHLDTQWFWYLPGQINAAVVYRSPDQGWWGSLSLAIGNLSVNSPGVQP
jgi:hypothetical protein